MKGIMMERGGNRIGMGCVRDDWKKGEENGLRVG
jgi:hypothetical protein